MGGVQATMSIESSLTAGGAVLNFLDVLIYPIRQTDLANYLDQTPNGQDWFSTLAL